MVLAFAAVVWRGNAAAWVNRFAPPVEELGVQLDRISPNLHDLLDFVLSSR
jgi:hypothetical protein